jgi:hypothetical protein
VADCYRELQNEELHNFYFPPSIIRAIKFCTQHPALMGEMRTSAEISERKRTFGDLCVEITADQ